MSRESGNIPSSPHDRSKRYRTFRESHASVFGKESGIPSSSSRKFLRRKMEKGNPQDKRTMPAGPFSEISQKERKRVPYTKQLARANFLALYWNEPLTKLTTAHGEILNGIEKSALPEDSTQTLGTFLTGKNESFSAFRDQLGAGNKKDVREALRRFKKLCPAPERLFEHPESLVNWMPWETFIAYGEVLQAHKTNTSGAISTIVRGKNYIEQARGFFSQGFPSKRIDIILERQNKDPKTQGIFEAVSNSIDALSKREKIGQFGLGVKQIFSWLEEGKGEARVITKKAAGEVLSLRARKGYDGQIYIKFDTPTPQEHSEVAKGHGTIIQLNDISVDASKKAELTAKLREQFQYVPETSLVINDEAITNNGRIKIVGRDSPVVPQGEVNVTINSDRITIQDTGSGMDQQALFTMFLPGHGKGYTAISPVEAQHIAQKQAEVLLVDDESPRMVFSRNREASFIVNIPKDRINTSSQTICLELGRILKVSEGRDGFELDENFATAIPILVEKTLRDSTLPMKEKTAFLNSLLLGIDQLTGGSEQPAEDKLAVIVRKTKTGIRTAAASYIKELRATGTVLLPNYATYQRITTTAAFLDPYLLKSLGDVGAVLREEGFPQLQHENGITTQNGWKVFTAPFEEVDSTQSLFSDLKQKEQLAQIRAQLAEVLPVIIDKEQRIVVVDQMVWQSIEGQQDSLKKAYLQESFQSIINDKVYTSYEAHDPRSILLQERTKVQEKEEVVKNELTYTEKMVLNKNPQQWRWVNDTTLFTLDSSGIMSRYDIATKEVDTMVIPELLGGDIPFAQATKEGIYLLTGGNFSFLNNQGVLRPELGAPTFNFDNIPGLSINEEGVVYCDPYSPLIAIYLPDKGYSAYIPHDTSRKVISPFLTSDKALVFVQNGRVIMADREAHKEKSTKEIDSRFEEDNTYKFFSLRDTLYVARFSHTTNAMQIHKISQLDNSLELHDELVLQSFPMDLTNITITTDDETGKIGIQTSNSFSFLQMTPEGIEHTETIKFETVEMANDIGYALATLKELFGDEESTSYSSGLDVLYKRLQSSPLVASWEVAQPATVTRESQKNSEKFPSPFLRDSLSKSELLKRLMEYSTKENHYIPEIIMEKSNKRDKRFITSREEMSKEAINDYTRIFGSTVPLEEKIEAKQLSDPLQKSPSQRTDTKTTLPSSEHMQRFLETISSEEFKGVFAPLWEEIKEYYPVKEQDQLKMRFVRNTPLLLTLSDHVPSSALLKCFFFSDNPQVFFDHTPEQQGQIAEMMDSIEGLKKKEGFMQFASFAVRGKSPTELETFYRQIDKIWDKDHLRQNFLQSLLQNTSELPGIIADPTKLEITHPLRAYLLFINNNAELLRTKENIFSADTYKDILPENVPLELLAYYRLTEGLFSLNEIHERINQEGGINAINEKIDLAHYRDEIRKAIHAQSVEPGVAKRELLQNALFAVRAKGVSSGNIAVDFYLRNNGREFVEEIIDTGTGIENALSFLVPGVTTKNGADGLGIFGTGFYKTFEDVDRVEVESVTTKEGKKVAQRMLIDLEKDAHGIVQGGNIRSLQEKPALQEEATGTSIKLIRNTEEQLPELEAMIAKNTYLTMGGLALTPEVMGDATSLSYFNEKGEKLSLSLVTTDISTVSHEVIGDITFVKAPSLPSAMTTIGLRMSPLAQTSSDYLDEVPEVLKTFLLDEHISVILPRSVPLVKDRSRIAHEEAYLPPLQATIATEAIKRAAYALLENSGGALRDFVPQDILSNPNYYTVFTSAEGKKAYAIAQKINKGMILNKEELSYINDKRDKDQLLSVLVGIEQTTGDGKKDSLLRRYQYIQEKAENTTASEQLQSSLMIDRSETAISPYLAQEENRLIPNAQGGIVVSRFAEATNRLLDRGQKPEGVTPLTETPLETKEKELLVRYFTNIGFDEVYFAPAEQMGAEGVADGRRLYLSTSLLNNNPRERLAVIMHESAHIFEKREKGVSDGLLDTQAEKTSAFTHQQDGPFAQHYKIASQAMQKTLLEDQESEEIG